MNPPFLGTAFCEDSTSMKLPLVLAVITVTLSLATIGCVSRSIEPDAELPANQGVAFVRIVHEGTNVDVEIKEVIGDRTLSDGVISVSEGDDVYTLFLDPGRYDFSAIGGISILGVWSESLSDKNLCPAFSVRKNQNNYIATLRIKMGSERYQISCAYDETEFRSAQEMFSTNFPSLSKEYGFWNAMDPDIPDAPSIAPIVRATANGEELALPAVLWSNETVGELVLGRSTLRRLTRILPAWPGHEPSPTNLDPTRHPPGMTEELHTILDRRRDGYNPRSTDFVLSFDQDEKLMLVQYKIGKEQGKPLSEALSTLTTFKEVFRDHHVFVERGRVGSCVIVDKIHNRPGSDLIYVEGGFSFSTVAYIYTCGA